MNAQIKENFPYDFVNNPAPLETGYRAHTLGWRLLVEVSPSDVEGYWHFFIFRLVAAEKIRSINPIFVNALPDYLSLALPFDRHRGWKKTPIAEPSFIEHMFDLDAEIKSIELENPYAGYVYFIEESQSGLIKIGYSRNPKKRLSSLQTSSPSQLKLLGFFEANLGRENDLHMMFSHLRVRGEWFQVDVRLRAFIKDSLEMQKCTEEVRLSHKTNI